jgi:hypothetical protein
MFRNMTIKTRVLTILAVLAGGYLVLLAVGRWPSHQSTRLYAVKRAAVPHSSQFYRDEWAG